MNKTLKITLAITAIVAALGLAGLGASLAFAQTQTPPAWGTGGIMGGGYRYGMMGGGYGMMGGFGQNGDTAWMQNMHQWMTTTGGMHNLVWGGLAEALGLTQDELNAELAAGKTLAQVAEAQGMSHEQLADALKASVKAGLDQAVADGALTQAQADGMLSQMAGRYEWMLSHMSSFGGGFDPGGCHGNFAPQNNS